MENQQQVIQFNNFRYCILTVENYDQNDISEKISFQYSIPTTNIQRRAEHFTGVKSIEKIIDSPISLYRSETEGVFSDRMFLSMTHTREKAAGIVHQNFNPGIDIENFREKILTIQHKFVREDERKLNVFQNEIEFLTLIWCVKESLYKAYRKGNADFKDDMQITSIRFFERKVNAILFGKQLFELNFKIENQFLISYTTALKIKE